MLTPEQIADGWIAHDGGLCPVPLDTTVTAKSARGGLFGAALTARADVLIWRNIIAYRPEPRHD